MIPGLICSLFSMIYIGRDRLGLDGRSAVKHDLHESSQAVPRQEFPV